MVPFNLWRLNYWFQAIVDSHRLGKISHQCKSMNEITYCLSAIHKHCSSHPEYRRFCLSNWRLQNRSDFRCIQLRSMKHTLRIGKRCLQRCTRDQRRRLFYRNREHRLMKKEAPLADATEARTSSTQHHWLWSLPSCNHGQSIDPLIRIVWIIWI